MGLLRKMFGPSQDEVWKQLADGLGAKFIEGGFWKGDAVVARAGDWTVKLDTFTVSHGKSSTTYTRLTAPFENPDAIHFSIGRQHLFSGVARWLGFQDIVIGDPDFDAAFVIKGDREEQVKAFFSNGRIKSILSRQPHVSFEVHRGAAGVFGNDLPEGVDQLRFVSPGVIKDLDQLRELFLLFSVALQHLAHLSSAYESDPELDRAAP